MSRELDAMQFVLDLLTDGIITSAVQQIGFTPHDKITEDELPHVQVYSPVDENQEQATRQPPGALTFQLDILDVFGNSNVLREAIAALDATLRIDDTMQGLVQDAFITLRSVAERKSDERSVVGAVITVQIEEGFPDPELTSILSFSEATLFSSTPGIELQNSRTIDGALGIRKFLTESVSSVNANDITGSPGFPMDLSGVHRLRLRLYIDSQNVALGNITLQLLSLGSANASTFFTNGRGGHGWVRPSFDLDDPAVVVGSGVNLSSIDEIKIVLNWGFLQAVVSETFGLIVADLGYTQRDTGLNNSRGYDPGF